MIDIELEGLDKITKKFEEIASKAKEIEETPMDIKKILTAEFLSKYTQFNSFDELCHKATAEYVANELLLK